VDRIADVLPRRRRTFGSAAGAQFWLEWRRGGFLLPLSVGTLLLVFIGPLSWLLRDDPAANVWILGWTLATPLILAAPIGKAFSKPDMWSRSTGVPSFVAIRPLSSGDWVAVKLKAAAFSAALTWLLVIAFLSVWLPFWADLELLSGVRIGFWMAYDHALSPQYAMAVLFLLAAFFVTWRFLVIGLWIGLSGNGKLYIASAAAYWLIVALGIIGLSLGADPTRVREWIRHDPNRLLAIIEWVVALAVIGKFWLAARTWRHVGATRVRNYFLAWAGASVCLVVLAVLLWAKGTLALLLMSFMGFQPLDTVRLGNLIVLTALLVIPFARAGLAPAALAMNRHGRQAAQTDLGDE